MPKIDRAFTKSNLSPSMSFILGMMVLTSGKVDSFSRIGIRCKSSLSFLSSYHDVHGIAFSG